MTCDWKAKLYDYQCLDHSYANANCVDEYVEGVPSDIDGFDLPYPPPDTYRIYRPQGLLGQDIAARLEQIYGTDETAPDWWLVERDEEVGYSEYTMESDYTYTVRVLRGLSLIDYSFESIGQLIRWIEGETVTGNDGRP
jgi:hypothetical protein